MGNQSEFTETTTGSICLWVDFRQSLTWNTYSTLRPGFPPGSMWTLSLGQLLHFSAPQLPYLDCDPSGLSQAMSILCTLGKEPISLLRRPMFVLGWPLGGRVGQLSEKGKEFKNNQKTLDWSLKRSDLIIRSQLPLVELAASPWGDRELLQDLHTWTLAPSVG
jgi:hypothetical protein